MKKITELQRLEEQKSELINDLMATETVIEEIWRYHPENPNKKDVVKEYNILQQIKSELQEELEELS